MKTILQEYLGVIQHIIPNFKEDMFPGCSEESIAQFEFELGVILPETYKSLLGIYNGEKSHKVLMAFSFNPTGEVLDQYKRIINGPSGFIHSCKVNFYQPNLLQPFYYSKKRVPFAYDGSGNSICIDFEPNAGGSIGQIIYLPLGDPEPMCVIAKNFDDYLQFLISSIESDRLKACIIHEIDEDGEYFEAHFEKTWRDDWTDIADEYNQKGGWC